MKTFLVIVNEDADKVCPLITVKKKPTKATFKVMSVKGQQVSKKTLSHATDIFSCVFIPSGASTN
jgi:hypothetical protein